VKSLRWRAAVALALASFPFPASLFRLVIPPAHAEAPARSAAPRTYSRTPTVRLPIQIDERTRAGLAELKLYVKGPSGGWTCAQAGPATQTSFDFRAEKDGEYAFLFVTVDKNGRSIPADLDGRPPHQIIVVDTTAPEIGIQPLPVANRDIYLKCQLNDANPDWSSVRLEYLAGDGQWKGLEPVSADSPGVFRIPHPSVLESRVRATAKDRAGNVGKREVDLGDPTQSFANAGRPAPAALPADIAKADLVAEPPEDPGAVQAGLRKPARGSELPEIKMPDFANKPPAKAEPKAPEVPGYNANRPVVPVEDPVAVPPVPDVLPTVEGSKPADLKVSPPADPAADKVDPFLQDIGPKAAPAKDEEPKSVRSVPNVQGAHPIIGTNRCTLDYAVENVIVGGQAKMEFWATRDSGRSWNRVTDEAQGGRSPAKLLLPGDGLHGIRIKANSNGLPPQPGEAPDAWVEVDTIAPTVRLMQPTLGTGSEAGTLAISWMVHDKNLVHDSLNLYHASRPEGPWQPIATNLRNEGNYRWLIPPGIGPEVYIKLEATDRAGNVGKAELRDPVAMPQPKVRVLGIGPSK
jgi:hypothetical protein